MKKIVIIQIILFVFLSISLAGGDEKEVKGGQEKIKSIALEYEKTALDDAAKDQLKIFLRVLPWLEKINNWQGPPRKLKIFRRRIARLLKMAAAISTDSQQKDYLNALADDISKNRFVSSPAQWLKQTNPKVDIILKQETGKNRPKLEVFILINHPELTRQAQKYIAVLDKMLDNLPKQVQSPSLDAAKVAPVLAADVAFSSQADKFLLVFPDAMKQSAGQDFKIIFFKNLLEAYSTQILKPLAEKVLAGKKAESIDAYAPFSNLLMHRLSHYLGPVFVAKQTDTPILVQRELKDLFASVEEIRADAAALYNISVLVNEKLFTEEQSRSLYLTYTIFLLAKLRASPVTAASSPDLILFNYFIKNGAFTFDINEKKLNIEVEKFKKAVKKLVVKVTQLESLGDYAGAKDFITMGKFSSASEELKILLKKVYKVPLSIKVTGFSEKVEPAPAVPGVKTEKGEKKEKRD